MKKTILVTGSAGFIGFHLSQKLLEFGYQVIGVDALTDYYDPQLKRDRLDILSDNADYSHNQFRIEEFEELQATFKAHKPNFVVHLAAQAGVRYSIDFPSEYVQTNLVGTFNILELSKSYDVSHLLMASTSSV